MLNLHSKLNKNAANYSKLNLFSLSCSVSAVGSTSVVFLIYNNIGDLLKPADDPGVADYSRYAAAGEITVNSPVIAAAISNPNTFVLNNVTFTLKHTQVQFD